MSQVKEGMPHTLTVWREHKTQHGRSVSVISTWGVLAGMIEVDVT